MEDLKAAAPSDPEDDRRFAAVARLSEINLELYRMFVSPWVRAASAPFASASKAIAPLTPAVRALVRCQSCHARGE
jgi:hypothetical protein